MITCHAMPYSIYWYFHGSFKSLLQKVYGVIIKQLKSLWHVGFDASIWYFYTWLLTFGENVILKLITAQNHLPGWHTVQYGVYTYFRYNSVQIRYVWIVCKLTSMYLQYLCNCIVNEYLEQIRHNYHKCSSLLCNVMYTLSKCRSYF